jgi:hypothetical protein
MMASHSGAEIYFNSDAPEMAAKNSGFRGELW